MSKNKSISSAVAVAAVVFSLFSLSAFYDVQIVHSFSNLPSSRRRFVVVANNRNRIGAKNIFSTQLQDAEVSVRSSSSKRSESRQQKGGKGNNGVVNNNHNNNKYRDRKEQQQRERERRELKNKLLRARDSILYFGEGSENEPGSGPSEELKSDILPTLTRSYSSVILRAPSPSSSSLDLFDPWDIRDVILQESRPVQERFLGLLAVLMQVTTHIQEEYTVYNNTAATRKAKQKSVAEITDLIRAVQSQLWRTCRLILEDMLAKTTNSAETMNQVTHVLSPIPITALATSLRALSAVSGENGNVYAGSGVEEIKELIQLVNEARIAASETHTHESIDDDKLDRALLTAWNCYLSSLCDRALITNNPYDSGLASAAALLRMKSNETGLVDPDITSYNTVMGNAAKLGNATLVDVLWEDLLVKRGELPEDRRLSLQPNSRTYNTRLMVTNDWAKRLEILDNEIHSDTHDNTANGATAPTEMTNIDGFTIDLLLIPLLQAHRKKELFELIDDWMITVDRHHHKPPRKGEATDEKQRKQNKNKAQRAFQNAMSAFFITLVQRNGDVCTARELWNRYMLVEIDNNKEVSNSGDDSGEETSSYSNATNIVFPERRHYNILLDGYARLVDEVRDRQGPNLDIAVKKIGFSKKKTSTNSKKIWQPNGDAGSDLDVVSNSKFYREVQEKAISDGQNLFAIMMAQAQQQNPRNKVGSDVYTKSTMIRLCRSGREVRNLLEQASDATSARAGRSPSDKTWLPRSVVRAAITTCGRLGDPSMACEIFEDFMFPENDSDRRKFFSNYRAFNNLLGALANGAKMENPKLNVMPTEFEGGTRPQTLLGHVHGLTCTEAVVCILDLMTSKNAQTYCVAASALQYAPLDEQSRYTPSSDGVDEKGTNTPLGLQIFHNATKNGIHADGRLVNAIFRCYGDDIAGALDGWKTHIRRATDQYENRTRLSTRKNMLAAYNGLLYVCGRAERPDIAVRIVYAMKKEGLEINENPYNCYRSGKTTREILLSSRPDEQEDVSKEGKWRRMRLPKLGMVGQYENILYVECKKYDMRDRRTQNDKRVRIIV